MNAKVSMECRVRRRCVSSFQLCVQTQPGSDDGGGDSDAGALELAASLLTQNHMHRWIQGKSCHLSLDLAFVDMWEMLMKRDVVQ